MGSLVGRGVGSGGENVGGGGKRERERSGGVNDAGDGGEQVELLLLLCTTMSNLINKVT
jgi:hypothetical protein